jgi:hypothetical protein
MYQVWDGDLFLFYVDSEVEALEHIESGFNVKVEVEFV